MDDCASREPGIWGLKDKMDDMGNPSGHCMAWGIYLMCKVSNIKIARFDVKKYTKESIAC